MRRSFLSFAYNRGMLDELIDEALDRVQGEAADDAVYRLGDLAYGNRDHEAALAYFEDLLAILAAWGPCEGCPADVTGDGRVDVEDLVIVLRGATK